MRRQLLHDPSFFVRGSSLTAVHSCVAWVFLSRTLRKSTRGSHFSLFSGVTHPLTDRLLALAWKHGWLPPTPETYRAKRD